MKIYSIASLALVACTTTNSLDQESPCSITQADTTDRSILLAPTVTVDPTVFASIPDPPPVLLFHEICPVACTDADSYGVSQTEFSRILQAVQAAGYTSIGSADYVRFMRGDWTHQPSKPILITFDDSRLDGYRGADDVLRVTNSRAVMFVITNRPDNDPFFMTWAEVAAAQASGRWDIQLHANAGHTTIPVTMADGTVSQVPYYAWRMDGETFDQWKARAENDIWTGLSLLRSKVPGFTQALFAVPYGDYGQFATNDPGIPVELKAFFAARFAVWFTQPTDNPDFSYTNGSSKERYRYTVRNTTTAETVYAWLVNRSLRRARTQSL